MKDLPKTKSDGFAEDVRTGLSANPKFLSSKYFYDDAGSLLFRRIMELPEYYLTRSENEIFESQKEDIVEAFIHQDRPFDLIELGAGDGAKTAVLIEYLLDREVDFTYSPIDISDKALEILTGKFKSSFPDLRMTARRGDYFRILEDLKLESARAKIIFFLGSNIGNFSHERTISFLNGLENVINSGDLLFIGFDLQKDPRIIRAAYDDTEGVTAQFNLNLLTRINRELGGDFELENFSHYASFLPIENAARSYLISRKRQTITIKSLAQTFEFDEWEPIFMEVSQKYNLPAIEALAVESGFTVVKNFVDSSEYFADSLWKKL